MSSTKMSAEARRVFILGAGFSKPAGLPLATELTDRVLERIQQDSDSTDEMSRFIEHIQELHARLNTRTGVKALNIEELYEYAQAFVERFRAEQHLLDVGRTAGMTPYSQAEDIRNWMGRVDHYLVRLLLDIERRASLDPVDRFCEALRPGDTVLTFNYDRLVERSLKSLRRPVSLGFEAVPESVQVLKLHGSIDWVGILRTERFPTDDMEVLFEKTDVNHERSHPDLPTSNEPEYDFKLWRVLEDEKLAQLLQYGGNVQQIRGWAGIGPAKSVSAVPGLGKVWAAARRALYEASEITVIGFSFSPFDRLAQAEFARVIGGRELKKVPAARISVVDPGILTTGYGSMSDRIQSVLGPIAVARACCHEQIEDWPTLR